MIDAKPWRASNAQAGSYALGMLGLEERKLLYHLTRNTYSGEGAVVELGAFCGASTSCLAAGLRDNPRAAGLRVHSYDSFIASEPYLVDFIRTQFGEPIELGQSFAAMFRRATAPFADLIEVHAGDLLSQSWPSGVPIEILFVDVAKTLALSARVLTEFFAHLTPGKSIVIHQDFYHPTAFYLPVVMEFLLDHFTIIEAGRDWSVVFRLEKDIPREKLEIAGRYNFSFRQQHAALRRMMRRVGLPGRDYLWLSNCALIGTAFGEPRFRAALSAAIRRAKLGADHVWLDGLAWCSDFKASRIRTRLYGSPSLMPPTTSVDKVYLKGFEVYSAVAERIARHSREGNAYPHFRSFSTGSGVVSGRHMSKDKLRLCLLILAVLTLASILFVERASRMEVPFAAFFLTASAWTIVIVLLARPEAVRSCALLSSSVFFGLAMIETSLYFVGRSQIIIVKTTPAPWRLDRRDVGSIPLPNSTIEFREFQDGRLISRVTYTIDANGLREIPAAVQGWPHKVIFFGCSFMFGHGVEDDQTLPYYFVQGSRGAFEGFNFAGEGWGPHQMLREIENGFVRRVAGTPDLAIYEVIPDHLRRVAGKAPWEDGPKYELCRGNEACYSGAFHSSYYNACRRWLDRSWTVKWFERHFAKLSRPSDLPLFLAVLKRTRSLLAENGTRFIIVLWDQNELANTMLKALKANQFDVVALSSIIPESALRKRHLTQLDQHPSPETNQAIAMYLWRNVGERSLAR